MPSYEPDYLTDYKARAYFMSVKRRPSPARWPGLASVVEGRFGRIRVFRFILDGLYAN